MTRPSDGVESLVVTMQDLAPLDELDDLDDLPQDGVEIEAAADAPNRCYQLQEAVPRTLQSATLPRTPSDPYPGRHIGAALDPPSLPRQLSQNSSVVCSQKDTVVTPSPLIYTLCNVASLDACRSSCETVWSGHDVTCKKPPPHAA